MNVNELMIGDLIYLLKNKTDIKGFDVVDACPRKVTAIRIDCDEPCVQTDDCDVFYDMSAYKPIPLTPEILEKYGFVEKSERRWVLSDEYTGDEVLVLLEVAIGFAMATAGLAIGFQNVHELQHLFKLCGIDKEIIL